MEAGDVQMFLDGLLRRRVRSAGERALAASVLRESREAIRAYLGRLEAAGRGEDAERYRRAIRGHEHGPAHVRYDEGTGHLRYRSFRLAPSNRRSLTLDAGRAPGCALASGAVLAAMVGLVGVGLWFWSRAVDLLSDYAVLLEQIPD